jgi:predicted dehydrogenase
MGEAQQTAWKLIRDGKPGNVRVAYAEVNWGRIESWHPAPQSFYEVGALFDVGVYPLTLLTSMFGPVTQVQSYSALLDPERVALDGTKFEVKTPDFMVSMLDFASGVVARLSTNFYVGHHTRQTGIEFHGDRGSVYLGSWLYFDGKVDFAENGGQYAPVPLLRDPYPGIPWGRGVADMAQALLEDRPHRFTGKQAAHIVEILDTAMLSAKTKTPVSLTSTFVQPTPMAWAE